MSFESAITAEVEALADLNLASLRDAWRKSYGDPPKLRSKDLLARLLAWRIQSDAFGGFDEWTVHALRSEKKGPPPIQLEPGTRLAREWKGIRYEAEVADDGIRYNGQCYRSLSEVARVITGTRWNGLRFFGLRERAPACVAIH